MIAVSSVAITGIVIMLVFNTHNKAAPAQPGTIMFVYKGADNSLAEIRSPDNWAIDTTATPPPEPYCTIRFDPCQ
jgi:hypothetical protein